MPSVLKMTKSTLYGDQKARADGMPDAIGEFDFSIPDDLSEGEAYHFHRILKLLALYKLDIPANFELLTMAARNRGTYDEVKKEYKEKSASPIIITPKGGLQHNPLYTEQTRLNVEYKKILSDMGLSAVALAKIGVAVGSGKKKTFAENFFDE